MIKMCPRLKIDGDIMLQRHETQEASVDRNKDRRGSVRGKSKTTPGLNLDMNDPLLTGITEPGLQMNR